MNVFLLQMNHLNVLGGSTSTVTLKRIVQTVLDDTIVPLMTLRGTATKISFSSYSFVYNLMLSSANKIDSNINAGVYEKFLKHYFKNCVSKKSMQS